MKRVVCQPIQFCRKIASSILEHKHYVVSQIKHLPEKILLCKHKIYVYTMSHFIIWVLFLVAVFVIYLHAFVFV